MVTYIIGKDHTTYIDFPNWGFRTFIELINQLKRENSFTVPEGEIFLKEGYILIRSENEIKEGKLSKLELFTLSPEGQTPA